jgi:hypothetical protein
MFVAKEARKDIQSWYVKMFGGEPWEARGEYIVSIPGVKFLRIAPCGSEYLACPESDPLRPRDGPSITSASRSRI